MSYRHNVGYHGRCGTQIEPLVTEQWWLKVDELKKPAILAVKEGRIKIVPSRFEKVYIDWLENLKDWNISRQSWFGIRIPIYYNASGDSSKEPYMMFSRENQAQEYYGAGNYEAETDTFDTWFSSSQWPFATLMATGEFDRFYPTSVMETGRDILFQWVARMVMLGLYRTEEVPFETIYLHGLVNDAQGKKMSKSRGNVIDPLEWTKRYGTDALRLALTIGITPGKDGALSEKKVEGYRNFCNKLWNVARYTLDKAGQGYKPAKPAPTSLPDHWILGRFSRENAIITKAIEAYRFSEAGERVYSLLWNDLADWYLEASKSQANIDVLVYCLETILKLAHPFAPFVTEAIWQNMPWQKQNLITASWPEPIKAPAAPEFEKIMALVSQIRAISTDLSLVKPKLLYQPNPLLDENAALITQLARVGEMEAVKQGRGLRLSSTDFNCWIDVDAATLRSYRTALERKRSGAGEYLQRLQAQLTNQSYLKNAPGELVQETKDRAQETELVVSKLDEQIRHITA
jgi:valyl-tRNA synthetase